MKTLGNKYTNIETISNDLVYGDDVELDDGRIIRLVVSQDDWDVASMIDDDLYGRVEYIDTTRYGRYGRCRPDWCDGSARIIHTMNGGSCWWQPPSDIKSSVSQIRNTQRYLTDLLENGFQIVTVELCRNETDAYGRPIVDDLSSLGGVEWYVGDDLYRREIISDLLTQIGL